MSKPCTGDYPDQAIERDRWILNLRPERAMIDPWKPRAFLIEEERSESDEVIRVATVFLANRECPWRCLMCDLWKDTLTESVPVGAIPAQIDHALSELAGTQSNVSARAVVPETSAASQSPGWNVRQIKLYNSGSFFDPRAIPIEDYTAIADRVTPFERVIVESHPALVGDRCLRFRDLLGASELKLPRESVSDPSRASSPQSDAAGGRPRLEVAMGLETAHPEVLEKLNKRMTLRDFAKAAEFLRENDIALRVFVLIKPPFLDELESLDWAQRSIRFAFDCGATVVSLIPTRPGNGALDALAERGRFSPPKMSTLEAALEHGIGLQRGRVFADLWDLEKFSGCPACFGARRSRLNEMNLRQHLTPRIVCGRCQGASR